MTTTTDADWLFYYDPSSEHDGAYTGEPEWEALFLHWCQRNSYNPHDLNLDKKEEVVEHHANGKVYLIRMPQGEIVSEQDEKGLTAFQIEQAKKTTDDHDAFLNDARRRQAGRDKERRTYRMVSEAAVPDRVDPEIL